MYSFSKCSPWIFLCESCTLILRLVQLASFKACSAGWVDDCFVIYPLDPFGRLALCYWTLPFVFDLHLKNYGWVGLPPRGHRGLKCVFFFFHGFSKLDVIEPSRIRVLCGFWTFYVEFTLVGWWLRGCSIKCCWVIQCIMGITADDVWNMWTPPFFHTNLVNVQKKMLKNGRQRCGKTTTITWGRKPIYRPTWGYHCARP